MANKIYDDIAEEINAEMDGYTPPRISEAQVQAAKYAWLGLLWMIDIATVYGLILIFSPYWLYAFIWLVCGAGSLSFAEWLVERIGNNGEQEKIARFLRAISALAVILVGLAVGLVVVGGIAIGNVLAERVFWSVTILLVAFSALQAYRYYDNDDERKAQSEEARRAAKHERDLRQIHRAGRTVSEREKQHALADKYRSRQGAAFDAARRAEGWKPPNRQAPSRPSSLPSDEDANPTRGGEQ